VRISNFLLIGAAAVLAIAPNAKAQSCNPMLTDIQNWFQTQPNGPGNYSINFNMVTNRSDGKYASYSEGSAGTPGQLYYHPASNVGFFFIPAYLQGDVTQYFSDRRFTTSPGTFAIDPFDPARTDQTRVTILLGNTILGAPFGQVTITLLSWGNAQSNFIPSCQNGLMYGFVGNTMFVMSLNKSYFPPIK
jgi:hypothetical protein